VAVAVAVLAAVAVTLVVATRSVSAGPPPPARYVQLSGVPGSVKAALYAPGEDVSPHVGVLLMHRTSNFLSHVGARELQRRGFMVLAMNPRSDNNEALVDFERNALDMKAGVEFLRSQPGITKVLLLGHSGGGPASSFYEAVAENGVAYCQDPRRLVKCPDALAGMPRVDGIILADAHPGIAVNAVRSINPAVRNEDRPDLGYDRTLDPFRVANGYNPNGTSTYSESFKRRYFQAQSRRMDELIAKAQHRVHEVESGGSFLTDDEPFTVYKGDAARLLQLDLSIHHSTSEPEKLLRNDGSISTEIVESVRPAQPGLREDNATLGAGTMMLTARSFLSGRAVRSTNSMDGLDYCSTNNSTRCGLEHISVPLLVTAMGGHYFIRDSEEYYKSARSQDKNFVVIEGATHGLGECTACETTPGQYANATRNLFDYLAAWINARY
jgi:hypothetical protein